MQNHNVPKKHKKLIIIAGLLLLIVIGFFAYKYIYIYTERKKYDKASTAIQKVASDLKRKGILSTYIKACGKTQGEFNSGVTVCSVGITYTGDLIVDYFKTKTEFIESVNQNDFYPTGTKIAGQTEYRLKNSTLPCTLINSGPDTDPKTSYISLDLSCGSNSKFKLF